MKFYRCRHCGNIIAYVDHVGANVMCCGEVMAEMVPNTVDASHEKHKPVVTLEKGKVIVNVGSVDHPMEEKHYIQWIALQTKEGNQRKTLKPGDAPRVVFYISEDDEVVDVFAYCNLHGLWK